MARFFGKVGYGVSKQVPAGSGKWIDTVDEFPYKGDILRESKDSPPGDGLNKDINISNRISIIANKHAIEHFAHIKYVRWAGVYWNVTSVEVQAPRLILSLGGVYNGPKA